MPQSGMSLSGVLGYTYILSPDGRTECFRQVFADHLQPGASGAILYAVVPAEDEVADYRLEPVK